METTLPILSGMQELEQSYASALENYLAGEEESALAQAYEMGRQAIAEGVGILGIATVHRQALATAEMPKGVPGDGRRWARRATEFFLESLSAFEMADRGVRENNVSLRHLNEASERRTVELETSNQQLAQEIADSGRAEQEARQFAGQLKAANDELEAFTYSVSHDLRAPLRAIGGFSDILMEEFAAQLPDGARRYLQVIRDNTSQMSCLIDDLLQLSRLGRMELKTTRVLPVDLVHKCLEELGVATNSRSIRITVAELPPCDADPLLLKQVWMNLLSNALKFTRWRDVACIQVDWLTADNHVPVYYVRDNGVGFDMRYAHKLFRVFQRLHSAEEYEGTGVGLAIVQRIIKRHGGRIWVEAEVDRGATFYFTLGGNSGGESSG